ncbi:MAG: hypothetical protein QOG25_627, partial [Acetobacteraceae bacterium]|nr:hypothetical protein [Acetobacteraceae bacterium]
MTNDTIARLCAAVDPAMMMRHLEEFACRMKLSGTPQVPPAGRGPSPTMQRPWSGEKIAATWFNRGLHAGGIERMMAP